MTLQKAMEKTASIINECVGELSDADVHLYFKAVIQEVEEQRKFVNEEAAS